LAVLGTDVQTSMLDSSWLIKVLLDFSLSYFTIIKVMGVATIVMAAKNIMLAILDG
jgi:hypothetical protein